ncbi:MAG: class I SAM-dependent DNA methyltransferase [Anaerolineales bacterium]
MSFSIDEVSVMKDYSESTYGENIAQVYDQWYTGFDPKSVSTLVELAKGGRALELGVGTGRIALPLSQAGIEVHGVDASPAMVAKLKAKSHGDDIRVSLGNFADVDVEGQFDLIYIVFNTFFALTTQDDQMRCFSNVASHLSSQGVFLIEAFVPDMSRFDNNQTVRVMAIEENGSRLETSQIDPIQQQINQQLIHLSAEGIRTYPLKIRYAWPAELDLMARMAGLTLGYRWGNWHKDALTPEAGKHISVYRHA